MEDGSDRPIVFVSRTLTPAEKKYSQLEKEGLAVVFGVCKFNQYLMGRSFTILSDHKPLQYLFSADRPVPVMASARIQRWALTLARISTTSLSRLSLQGNVDALSRLPLEETPSSTPLPGDTVLMLEALDSSSPVTSAAIKSWTDKDPVLSHVRGFVLHGNWEPVEQDANFKPFKNRELELSVQDGCERRYYRNAS